MATLRNFQMKNIKKTRGMEGEGCTGTMYLNGKKVGTYADYADGALEMSNTSPKKQKKR